MEEQEQISPKTKINPRTRQSSIPLSPTTLTFPRTLPSSPTLPSGVFNSSKSPFPPPRPPRSPIQELPQPRNARGDAGGSTERDARPTFNPGWVAPFPNKQEPKRPARPQRPEQALMFDMRGANLSMRKAAKRKAVLFDPPRTGESTLSSEVEEVDSVLEPGEEEIDLATIVQIRKASFSSGTLAQAPTRKTVPTPLEPGTEGVPPLPLSTPSTSYLVDLPKSSPSSDLDSPASSMSQVDPHMSPASEDVNLSRRSYPINRLSISGFDALLARGEQEQSSSDGSNVDKENEKLGKGKERAITPRIEFREIGNVLPSAISVGGIRRRSSVFGANLTPAFENGQWGDMGIRRSSTIAGPLPPGAGAPEPQPSPQLLEAVWKPRNRDQVIHIPSQTKGEEEKEKEERRGNRDGSESSRDTTLREGRMQFAFVEYSGWFPRVLQFFYPLFIFFHYPATLFLDYNVIYTVAQLGLYPDLPSTVTSNIFRRAAVSVPRISPSTAYWVALGVYCLCVFLWGTLVCLWLEVGRGYIRLWGRGGTIQVGRVYTGTASFNFACLKSYSYFCFLYRIRLAPFQRNSAVQVKGTTWVDGVLETCSWYSQNWPTVLLLLPRAGLSLAILLLYGTTAYGQPGTDSMLRDPGYFQRNGTLTGFASGILLTNCCWACYRLALVVISFLGLLVLGQPLSPINSFTPSPVLTNDFLSHDPDLLDSTSWRSRRNRRIRAAILLCSPFSSFTPTSFNKFSSPDSNYDDDKQNERRRRRKIEKEDERLAKLALGGIDWSQYEVETPPTSGKMTGTVTEVGTGTTGKPNSTGRRPWDHFSPYSVHFPQLSNTTTSLLVTPTRNFDRSPTSPNVSSLGVEDSRSPSSLQEPASSTFYHPTPNEPSNTSPLTTSHPPRRSTSHSDSEAEIMATPKSTPRPGWLLQSGFSSPNSTTIEAEEGLGIDNVGQGRRQSFPSMTNNTNLLPFSSTSISPLFSNSTTLNRPSRPPPPPPSEAPLPSSIPFSYSPPLVIARSPPTTSTSNFESHRNSTQSLSPNLVLSPASPKTKLIFDDEDVAGYITTTSEELNLPSSPKQVEYENITASASSSERQRKLLQEVQKLDEEDLVKVLEEKRLARLLSISTRISEEGTDVDEEISRRSSEVEERLHHDYDYDRQRGSGGGGHHSRSDSEVGSPVILNTVDSGFLLPPFRLSYDDGTSTQFQQQPQQTRRSGLSTNSGGLGAFDFDDYVRSSPPDSIDGGIDRPFGTPMSGRSMLSEVGAGGGAELETQVGTAPQVNTTPPTRWAPRNRRTSGGVRAVDLSSPVGTFGVRSRDSMLPPTPR